MKKIHEWELWDWKSIIGAVIVFAGLAIFLGVCNKAPDLLRNRKGKEYDQSVKGRVISYSVSTYLSQGRTGTRTSVQGIKVSFFYTVSGTVYYNSDLIPQSLTNQVFLEKLYRTPEMDIEVKYAGWNPQLSQIQLKPHADTLYKGNAPPLLYMPKSKDSL
jgi:hypothetical protein